MVTVTINQSSKKNFHDIPKRTWFTGSMADSKMALCFKFGRDHIYKPRYIPPVYTPGTLVVVHAFCEVRPGFHISCNYSPPISFGYIRVGDAFLYAEDLYIKLCTKQGLLLDGDDSGINQFVDSNLVLPIDLEITA